MTPKKNKLEKKYNSLIYDVNKMLDQAEKRAVEQNLAKMKQKSEDELAKMKQNLTNMKKASEDELAKMK
jgi:ElaB/YqjD/DUF883 family membrane-anchored ribosome-binding protein